MAMPYSAGLTSITAQNPGSLTPISAEAPSLNTKICHCTAIEGEVGVKRKSWGGLLESGSRTTNNAWFVVIENESCWFDISWPGLVSRIDLHGRQFWLIA